MHCDITQLKNMKKSSDGFTLIEAMIALAILSIGISAVVAMQTSASFSNRDSRKITESTQFATDQLETLLALSYNSSNLQDENDNDDDADAGLDDIGGSADYQTTQGIYTICWNVAVDNPAPDVKTVRVIVLDENDDIMATITQIKANWPS